MKNNKIFIFLAIICCCGILPVFASAQPRVLEKFSQGVGGSDALIEQMLSDIETAYMSRSVNMMSDLLDKDYENLLNFKSALESFFLNVKELQIYFVVDTILVEKNKVSVRLHWFKKVIDNSGAFKKIQGSSQLVFRNSDGGLKLLYWRGDNPFYT